MTLPQKGFVVIKCQTTAPNGQYEVCVPRHWIKMELPNQMVVIAYPDEDKVETEMRILNSDEVDDDWDLLIGEIQYETDSYENAGNFLNSQINNLTKENTQQTEENSSIIEPATLPNESLKVRIVRSKILPETHEHKSKLGRKKILQIASNPDSRQHDANKRTHSKQHSNTEFSAQAKSDSININKRNSITIARSARKRQSEYDSSEDNTNTESFTPENKQLLVNLQMENQQLRNDMKKLLEHGTDLYSKLNSSYEKIEYLMSKNHESSEKTTQDDDEMEVSNCSEIQETLKSVAKPTKPKITKDMSLTSPGGTLRHPHPGEGLIELGPNTGIYINAKGLWKCMKRCNNVRGFARALLPEVFNRQALEGCTLTGSTYRQVTLPPLDPKARVVLVEYAMQYAKQVGWQQIPPALVFNSLRARLLEYRNKKVLVEQH